ncbi:MAG: hypothetical protein ABJF23_07625 [Bryobacteraceae bacterium]
MRSKIAWVVVLGVSVLVPTAGWTQAKPFQNYKTQEDYCVHNPQAPTCIKRRPFSPEVLKPAYKPLTRGSAAAPRAVVVSPAPAMIVLGEPDWRFAHPRADLLGSINVTGLIRSPLVRMLLTELSSSGGLTAADVGSALSRASEIEKFSISVRAKDILVLMTGTLDSLESLAKPGGNMSFHRVSADSILVGTEPSLSEAMRRLASPATPPLGLAVRAKELTRRNDFWLTGSPAFLAAFGNKTSGATIRDFTFSLLLRDPLRLDMVLNTLTAADAQRMFTLYQQNTRGKAGPGQQSATVEGAAIHLVYTLQETEARAGLREFLSSAGGKQIGALLAAGKQGGRESAPASAESTGKVVIHGLEGGPREIPLKNP